MTEVLHIRRRSVYRRWNTSNRHATQSRISKFVDVDVASFFPSFNSTPATSCSILFAPGCRPHRAVSRRWEIQHHGPKWRLTPWKSRAATVDLIIIISPDQLRPGTLKSNTTPAVCYHPPHHRSFLHLNFRGALIFEINLAWLMTEVIKCPLKKFVVKIYKVNYIMLKI